MEKLIERARAAMNLLLIFSIIIIIGAVNDDRPTKKLVNQMCEELKELSGEIKKRTYIDSSTLTFCKTADKELTSNKTILLDIKLKDIQLFITGSKGIYIPSYCTDAEHIDDINCTKIAAGAIQAFFGNYKLIPIMNSILDNARKFDIGTNGTVKDIDDVEMGQVNLPVVGIKVRISIGFLLFGIFLIAPYTYIISVVVTIGQESKYLTKREGVDWVFFQTKPFGLMIGFLWLLFPITGPAIGIIKETIIPSLGYMMIVGIAVFSLLAMYFILKARKNVYMAFQKFEGVVEPSKI
jgi:hypothetical protein